MNKKLEKSGLILAIIVLIAVIVVGVWWYYGQSTMSSTSTNLSTTTPTTVQKSVAIDRDSNESVNAILASLPDASAFYSYYTATGVSSLITGKGPYTVFVPTNEAFGLEKSGSISGLSATAKKRLVEYHIVKDRAVSANASFFGSVQALSGDTLNFSDNEAGEPQVNSSFITHEYQGNNGVVYVISEVLLPPTK
jgi:uncharacterized surface protein with fasciclin (FAS1) repeats